jgi:hypothetical protein
MVRVVGILRQCIEGERNLFTRAMLVLPPTWPRRHADFACPGFAALSPEGGRWREMEMEMEEQEEQGRSR